MTSTSHSRTPPPNFRDGARRRRHILAVARRLFLDHGFHATTTRKIARAAGVSDALLYRYFPSKRHLFDAVIDDGLEHLEPYLKFGAPVLAGLRLRETLEAAAYTAVEIVRRDQEVFQLMMSETKLLAGDGRITYVFDQLHQHFAERVRGFIDEGEARDCDPLVFARQFIGGIVMFDLFNHTLGRPDEAIDLDTYVREVVDAALRSLA